MTARTDEDHNDKQAAKPRGSTQRNLPIGPNGGLFRSPEGDYLWSVSEFHKVGRSRFKWVLVLRWHSDIARSERAELIADTPLPRNDSLLHWNVFTGPHPNDDRLSSMAKLAEQGIQSQSPPPQFHAPPGLQSAGTVIRHASLERFAYGWPFRSLYYEVEDLPTGIKMKGLIDERRWRLPYFVYPAGFIACTLFYSLHWAALFMGAHASLVVMRSARRQDKGHCPHCAYDLSHNFSAGCPECGWNKTPAAPCPS